MHTLPWFRMNWLSILMLGMTVMVLVMTPGEGPFALAEVCADRWEPAGEWSFDESGRVTLNGALFTGMQIQYLNNGRKLETPYREGKIDGTVMAWHPNGPKESEMLYREGKKDGISVSWYTNGRKRSETTYRENKVEGVVSSWDASGQKQSEWTYRDGKVDGVATSWHPNGQKQSETTYRDGKIEGTSVMWYSNGQKRLEEITGKDNKVSLGWHENGQRAWEQKWDVSAQALKAKQDALVALNGEEDIEVLKAKQNEISMSNMIKGIWWDANGKETKVVTLMTAVASVTPLTLGAQLQESPLGLTVVAITPESPAARASLQVGDMLVSLEGRPVPLVAADFLAQLADFADSSLIKLVVNRTGERLTLWLPWWRQDAPPTSSGQVPVQAPPKPVKKTPSSRDPQSGRIP